MSISDGLFTGVWLNVLHLIYLAALGYAIYRAPWHALAANRGLQHLCFGATVALIILWSMRAGISPGLSIHFLGVTALTLILGWDLAILSATSVLLVMTLLGRESIEGISVNGLCLAVLPALLTHLIHQWVERTFAKNFFIYLFLCAFIGAALVTAASGLGMGMLLWLDDVYPWSKIMHEYVRYLPLIMFPEALLNGILMTGIMVFYPDWIRTFDAVAYIDEQ